MTIVELLDREAAGERQRLIVAAGIAGFANALILSTINAAAQTPEDRGVGTIVFFILLVALFVVCSRYINHRTTGLIEALLHRIKVRVGERIARAELDTLEQIRTAEICDRITENMSFISDRARTIASMLGSAFLCTFALLYIAWLSLPAFAAVVVLCGLSATLFATLPLSLVTEFQKSAATRLTFFDRLTDLLGGFKELKFSRRRSEELRADIAGALTSLRGSGISANNMISDFLLLGQVILFALLGVVVYSLYVNKLADKTTMAGLVAGVMFLWSPFTNVTLGMTPYMRANAALAEIEVLEQKLSHAARGPIAQQPAADPWRGHLQTLAARDIEYAYPASHGDERFRIGPLSFTLSAGEVVFIVGGNGSGKSTLVKVLTGLYAPSGGELLVNGIAVGPSNLVSFRDMISAIFSDFHLFGRLYGIEGDAEATATRLLAKMRLEGKTTIADGRITKLTLSTGQRKRLAMVVALLEDRPFYVFDEWTADQDPEFRLYFYAELLPFLRQQGKTVLVVSHDDRYFHHADRVITMEYGQVRSIREGAQPRVTT